MDKASGEALQTRAGAEAFSELLNVIRMVSSDTVWEFGESIDGRDYTRMSRVVAHSIVDNLGRATGASRDGYLRALTDLLCLVADEALPEKDRDPLKVTEPAFLAEKIGRGAIATAQICAMGGGSAPAA